MPRKNLKPFILYAELSPNQDGLLYEHGERFMDREMADTEASLMRRSWEGRIVEIHEIHDYPIPATKLAGGGCPPIGRI